MWIQQTAESMTIVGGDMPTRPPLLVCDYIACHSIVFMSWEYIAIA